MLTVREVASAIESIAPPSLAEEWDNCGLQVGDPASTVSRVLVGLTPLPEIFDEAGETGADLLLFHHPLIFQPLSSMDTSSYPGDLIARAIRNGIAVYAAHTSYDAVPDGVSAALARAVGLQGTLEILAPRGEMRKLAVFVPEENIEAVAGALASAGAGVIGDYTRCTFRTRGTGTFLGGEGTDPYAGEKGRLERVDEIRLETIVPAHLAARAEAAVRRAHPYEEPALDIYTIEGYPEGCGYGRVGSLHAPMTAAELATRVSGSLGSQSRLVADTKPGRRLQRAAVMGGSGGSFIRTAAAAGADVYITGDLDYHDALLAESLGLAAIDAGHAPTELPSLPPLARKLDDMLSIPVSISRVRR